MKSNQIRKAFLDYFEKAGHEIVASAPLPQKDNPTLLFTNAGMNQFADVFLGKEKRSYVRAATAQKCMRVQGKHNDLENVGPSPRHHTFFEMLGNFSFGDYFKEGAIRYGYEFLTEVCGIPAEKLYFTVHTDDDEAYQIWLEKMGAPADHILRMGDKTNFWMMGDIGPCGPTSEIHYDWGPEHCTCGEPDCSVLLDNDCGRWLEMWNLVFMQFNQDETGSRTPLPRPGVDTGLGLERITSVLQKTPINYETDLFTPAMDVVQELLHHSDAERETQFVPYRVIADHVRAATFLIADGVRPGNDGADYVLRMVIRRAGKFGRELGFERPFMAYVAQAYIDSMSQAYPEIAMHADLIRHTLTQEEERFSRTLETALIQLDRLLESLRQEDKTRIPGDVAFQLYATHGLPLEITRDIAGGQGFSVDERGFREAREAHALASGEGKFKGYETGETVYATLLKDLVDEGRLPLSGVVQEPYGPPRLEAPILAILRDGGRTDTAKTGDEVEIVTGATPFYVESGGQISDIGSITVAATGGQILVESMHRPVEGLIVHRGRVVQGEIRLDSQAILRIDDDRRADIRRNHTATHVLHEELRRHLGKHVTQAGSLVAPDRLRFDFTHDAPLSEGQLVEIEQSINEVILANFPVTIAYMDQREAIQKGAMALFGEKYGSTVRTVKIGAPEKPYSFELCGGLHVRETGEINLFHFISEGSVSAGVRRIEAITGRAAHAFFAARLAILNRVVDRLNIPVEELESRVDQLLSENKALQKEVDRLKRGALIGRFDDLLQEIQEIDGVPLLAAVVDGADADALRELTDRFRGKNKSGVAVLGSVHDGRPILVAMVTDDWVVKGIHAGNIVREAAKIVGGGGGGRPNLAQAGGRDAGKLPEALAAVPDLVRAMIQS